MVWRHFTVCTLHLILLGCDDEKLQVQKYSFPFIRGTKNFGI
jgi:hypothetical protein